MRLVEAAQRAYKDISAFEYLGGGSSFDNDGLSSCHDEGLCVGGVGVAGGEFDAGDLMREVGGVEEGSCDGHTYRRRRSGEMQRRRRCRGACITDQLGR